MKKHVLYILLLICILLLVGCGKQPERCVWLTQYMVSLGIMDADMRTDDGKLLTWVTDEMKEVEIEGANCYTADLRYSDEEEINSEMADRLYGIYAVSESGDIFYQYNMAEDVWEQMVFGGSEGPQLDTDEAVKIYQEIYTEVTESDTVYVEEDLERIRHIVQKLGEKGYVAIDSENQIDMTEKEQVLSFCKSVDKKEETELTIISVEALYKFIIYRLSTANGKVKVSRELYQYINECFEMVSTASYAADSWQYTKEGYLIFTGSSYSEESYVLTMSDVPETAAFRVEPLNEQCREYNRRYIRSVGYRSNNMFLCDWNEEDYGELDFYDIFDQFYPSLYQQPVPYVADVNINVGAVYQIREDEFENVVTMHFAMDKETLQAKTKYLPEEKAYEYRPRGFYEVEYPNIPYPEVVSYDTNDDGTITLTVNAVYPSEGTSKAYTHEMVIRPLEDEGFQYVSNTVIPSKDDYGTSWHTDRLTDAEWEEIYGGLPQLYAVY